MKIGKWHVFLFVTDHPEKVKAIDALSTGKDFTVVIRQDNHPKTVKQYERIKAAIDGTSYIARKPRRKQPVISSEQGAGEQKSLDVAQCSVDDIRENCGANMGVWQGGDLR